MATTPKSSQAKDTTPNYLELMQQAGDAWLAQVSEMQENSLKLAERMTQSLPKSDAFPLPKVDGSDFGIPSARELIEVNFSIMDKFLANQRAYFDRLMRISGS